MRAPAAAPATSITSHRGLSATRTELCSPQIHAEALTSNRMVFGGWGLRRRAGLGGGGVPLMGLAPLAEETRASPLSSCSPCEGTRRSRHPQARKRGRSGAPPRWHPDRRLPTSGVGWIRVCSFSHQPMARCFRSPSRQRASCFFDIFGPSKVFQHPIT